MVRLVEGRWRFVLLGTILAAAAALRFWGIGWGLYDANITRRPHPDEWVAYWLWRWFDQHHSLNPCPAPTGRQCFFDWGSVYIDLSYLFHLLTGGLISAVSNGQFGAQADPRFIQTELAGRSFSALISALTILAVYRLGAAMYRPAAGLVAALFLALSALCIQLGHFATPDSTTIFLVTVTLWLAYEATASPSAGRFALAGASAGLALGTEYHMGLLALPLATAWWLTGERRTGWLAWAGLAMVATSLMSNPYVIVDAFSFGTALWHSVLIRTVDSGTAYGGSFDRLGPVWAYIVRYPLGFGAGAALALVFLAGLVWGIVRRGRQEYLLFTWLVPYALLVTLSPAKFMRYSAPLFPALAVLAGGMAVAFLSSPQRRVHLSAVGALAVVTVATSLYDLAYVGLFTRPEPRWQTTQWLRQHSAPGSLIGFEQLPNGLVNLPYFISQAGFRPCFAQFQPNRLASPAQYLLEDHYALEEHPRVTQADVDGFLRAVRDSPRYQLVQEFHYVPRILGFSFPIDQAPHDWRYTDHDIRVYRNIQTTSPPAGFCFSSLNRAIAALYVKSRPA